MRSGTVLHHVEAPWRTRPCTLTHVQKTNCLLINSSYHRHQDIQSEIKGFIQFPVVKTEKKIKDSLNLKPAPTNQGPPVLIQKEETAPNSTSAQSSSRFSPSCWHFYCDVPRCLVVVQSHDSSSTHGNCPGCGPGSSLGTVVTFVSPRGAARVLRC